MLKTFVDSTGRYARITTFMKDIGSDKMDVIQKRLKAVIDKFPLVFISKTIIGNLFSSLNVNAVISITFKPFAMTSLNVIVSNFTAFSSTSGSTL